MGQAFEDLLNAHAHFVITDDAFNGRADASDNGLTATHLGAASNIGRIGSCCRPHCLLLVEFVTILLT